MRMPQRTAPAAATPPGAPEEASLRARLAAAPGDAAAWQRLALLLAGTGRAAEAAEAFTSAIAAGAPPAPLAAPQALALSAAGRHEEAAGIIAAARARRPKDFALANLHGVLLKRAGRLAEALAALQLARRLDPRNASACQNLGNVLELLGRDRDAAAAFQAGVANEPRNAELLRLHGRALRRCGEAEAALLSLERGFALDPRAPELLADLLGSLLDLGRAERMAQVIDRVRKLRPDDPILDVAEARLHLRLGRTAAAREVLERLLLARPGLPEACVLLARVHGDGDRRAANAALRQGLSHHPGNALLAGELVDSLIRSRYDDEAALIEEAYQLACDLLARDPVGARGHAKALRTAFQRCLDNDRLEATGTLAELAPGWVARGQLSALHYELGRVETLEDRIRIVEWHRDWGRREQRRVTPLPPPALPALATGRKIRVGFMSSDLRHHPVSYFAKPLFDLYDRDRFEVFCYSFFERAADAVQQDIAAKVDGFRLWPRRPDAEVAAGIAEDRLDILFELGGSTAMNKLEVMAYRPARIGASWLGYPHSAGLESIDLILTDPYLRPADPRLLIERPFELPETWVALDRLGFYDEPILEGLPEERAGRLTFGTMNNPYKFTPACLDAWGAVLRAVPGARFLFVRPEGRTPAFIANARTAFAARGVDPDRLAFIAVRGQHLKHYNAIDIALDSLPHVGGTTTCETLWMGVPTISLVGPGFPERLSYSNLSNAGLGDLAVASVEAYVAAAVAMAEDRARRRLLRHGLRQMIRARPLGQVDRFARHFYAKVAEVAAA